MQQARDDRSLGELFAQLTRDLTTLMREEGALARAEMSEKLKKLGMDSALLIAGGAIAYAGFLALVATAIIAIAYALPWWLAALIVGAAVTALGGALALAGLSAMQRVDPVPRETIQTIQEDAAVVRRHAS